ncbi:hypothetical protein HU200_057797 [Digitaria exilis]|uniref:Secreted protein n=1 Tax=Digitaria exilis TaxID=1010633 RepID=A0A835AAH2_9POAL|nr:hypothetical protein HU200_057797 [Digitaria exilis]
MIVGALPVCLLAIAAARVSCRALQLPAPAVSIWVPVARHLPGACAALCDALASHAAWLRAVRRRGGIDEELRRALLAISY